VLAENHRLLLLPEIAAHYEALRSAVEKHIDVEVVSAVPLNAAQADKLEQALSTRLKRRVRMQNSVDSSLLGGAVVRAGDLVYRRLVEKRLQRLATDLGKLGTIYVHQGIGNQRPDQGAHRKFQSATEARQRRTVVSVTERHRPYPRSADARYGEMLEFGRPTPIGLALNLEQDSVGSVGARRLQAHLPRDRWSRPRPYLEVPVGPNYWGRVVDAWAAHRRQGPGECPS